MAHSLGTTVIKDEYSNVMVSSKAVLLKWKEYFEKLMNKENDLFLFAVTMDRLTDEERREPLWTMLFADDMAICKETREEVEWRLECWRYTYWKEER